MNISIVEQKEGFVRLQVDVAKIDYQDEHKKELKHVARSAKVKGFREGKAPVGMIEKMYGEGVRYEVINRMVGKLVDEFIKEKEYKVIGWAIPEENNGVEMTKEDMTLFFKLALHPAEYDTDFSGKTFTKYEVTVTEEEVAKQLEDMQQGSSRMQETDQVVENAVVGGDIAELDGDTRKEDGIVRENVTIYPDFMKDEDEKAKFKDAGKGSVVVFNPYKAFNGNEAELSSLIGIEKEEVESLKDKEFSFQIETIRHMVPAELDQEFFDSVFGEGKVTNEDEAKAKIREYMEAAEQGNADYKFTSDFLDFAKDEKASKLELADDLIIEWYSDNLKRNDDEEGLKNLNKEALIKSLKRELYVRHLANEEKLEVSEEDVRGFAYEMVRNQFAQMGWTNPDHEIVANYANKQLEDSNFAYSVEMNILEQKVGKAMQDKVKLETKQVTVNELHDILNPKKEETTEE
ncbi:trigger factor [Porphyromonas levii]|uniref:trigger factor n=1 Tax=Porphyromonas levii TaxID=28114 RepID=UPI001B8BA57F|nr:trigger factor [Porphyromonas levii]MBR8703673.1 Trigger factor [Porphyromonas levii]MBR8713548.1 Trigger factor [Porphyromonas levii]MBR8715584.1 Trigger factor [Porphyromonas levii]MBR8728109.1 Trigger factor [Porphyromonas levii]MBR8729482.1 Trigger factor [Porphyromonas levii]